ncbi:hypothetical protein CKAH01_02385 [Colletotrichum kahawae]|uniref:Uncharacterized protein n=1 Tax=Colletotrichum kahawae TaxID=34407 RepID=A0AAD9Y0A7_COLKA|nr:hypothetical protein CKAH01_02385 [Colletotrichum kahawae]
MGTTRDRRGGGDWTPTRTPASVLADVEAQGQDTPHTGHTACKGNQRALPSFDPLRPRQGEGKTRRDWFRVDKLGQQHQLASHWATTSTVATTSQCRHEERSEQASVEPQSRDGSGSLIHSGDHPNLHTVLAARLAVQCWRALAGLPLSLKNLTPAFWQSAACDFSIRKTIFHAPSVAQHTSPTPPPLRSKARQSKAKTAKQRRARAETRDPGRITDDPTDAAAQHTLRWTAQARASNRRATVPPHVIRTVSYPACASRCRAACLAVQDGALCGIGFANAVC